MSYEHGGVGTGDIEAQISEVEAAEVLQLPPSSAFAKLFTPLDEGRCPEKSEKCRHLPPYISA